ncbi:hypothetical protein M427DRAFT_61627 [Gonapodya prolifera JEL478]|uniref:Uncharacterized protein n=1 Tax=Gonapodya prolifera (strain JEL478) TaxID=1344416 RepID=A0A139A1X0_GONPJ|nr:hypothetical protein M427DRAFT_61627 [Gonapodya prolifera JEL478]|eukprot:KXS10689.1 hypothetical protein M427DRAFT_61627 [Gonapodya prolifera JEL478]
MSTAASSSSAPPSTMNPPPARPRLPKHPTQQDIDNARDTSVLRLKASWEAIWAKYEAMGDNDDDDVIDLESETIIVDRGNVRNGPVRVFGSALSDVIGEEDETQEQEQSDNLGGKTTSLRRKALSAARGSACESEHDATLQPWSSDDFDSLLASPSLADARPRRYDLTKSLPTIAKHLAPADNDDDDVDPLTSSLPDIPATPTPVLRDPRGVRPVEVHRDTLRGGMIHEPEVKPETASDDLNVVIKQEPTATDATGDSVRIKPETVDHPPAPLHLLATDTDRIKDEPADDLPIKQEPLDNFSHSRSPAPVLPTSSTPPPTSSLLASLSTSSSPSSSPTTTSHTHTLSSHHTPAPSSPLKRKIRFDDRAPTPPLYAVSASSLTGSGRHHMKRIAAPAPALGVDAEIETEKGGRARWKESMRLRRRGLQAGEDGEVGGGEGEGRRLEMPPAAEDDRVTKRSSTRRRVGAYPTPPSLKHISALRIWSSPPAHESEQGHDPAQAALDALFDDNEDELVGAGADGSRAHKLEREKSQEKGIVRKALATTGAGTGPRRREWKWLKDLYGGEVAGGDDPLVG